MKSHTSRIITVGVTLLILSVFSVVLYADESANDATVTNDASSEDHAPKEGDITSDTILGGSEGSTTPVTSISPDTKPPSDDSTPTGDKADSDEETEYFKFTGVQSISSPIVEKSSFQTSLFTGAASYSYPLELPRGTNGLTPQISLGYNSQSAIGQSGIVGLGWDLGLNYVERDVNYTPDNFSDDRFVLILNGERHDLVYASSDGRYHTQIESYLFINKSNSSMNNTFTDYWLVKSKDGVEYQFGFYNGNHVYNSEVVCSRGTYVTRWYLDQIKDTHSNTVTLAYNQSEGAVYPYSIIYSNKEIDFIFENRSDAVTIYVQGCRVRESQRLKSAVIKVNSTILRYYNLSYAFDGRSLLNSITEYATNGSSLPATVFDYQSIQGGWQAVSGWSVPNIDVQSRMGFHFVDVNNDGLVDIIRSFQDDSVDESSAWLNNGSGWVQADNWKPPIFFSVRLNGVIRDKGVEFADFNEDGLLDLFQMNHTTCKIWFNTGNGWATPPDTSWPKPPGMGDIELDGSGVRVADINGDGKVDILRGFNDERTVWINNGSGWYNASNTWKLPVSFTNHSQSYYDTDVVMTDVNGDGLIDLIKRGSPGGTSGGIWLNNGSGWLRESDGSSIPINLENERGIRVTDVNGDSLVDILRGEQNAVSSYHSWISNGSGWTQNDTYWAPITHFIDYPYETAILSDLNGDGLIDIIDRQENVYLNKGPYPGLLKNIHFSLGGLITINYTASTIVNNSGTDGISHLGFPIWIVGSVAEDNGMIDAQNILDITRYNYSSGLYDTADKEFRGFEYVNVTNYLGNYDYYRFYQDDSKKGKLRSAYSFDKNGLYYSGTENNWTNSTNQGGYYEVLLSGTTDYTFDGIQSNPKSVTTQYVYDSYGNPIQINYLGTSVSGDEKYVANTYVVNTNKWIVNRVANSSLSYPLNNVLVRTEYYYDNSTSLTTPPSLGDVTKERHLVNGSYVESRSGYYSSGALRNVTDAEGRTTFYEYDNTYTFPKKITNAKGQETNYTYDLGTGNLLNVTDPNGYMTYYLYDVFGRRIKEVRPIDSTSNPTVLYNYSRDGIAPESVKVSTKTDSDTLDVYQFVDGFGRLIQTRRESEDSSKQIVENVFYDSLGRVEKQYMPYNETSSAVYTTPQAGIKYVQYGYDPIGRVNKTTNPDGNYSTGSYDHWNVTVKDENGHQKNYYMDAYKRVYKVEERNSGEVYSTTYNYSAKDELVKITDSKGNVFSFGFDELGRKVNMTDPDMGIWLYTYDNVGNLRTQRDSRNNLTSFGYDPLNRVTSVNYSDGKKIVYVYDKDSPYSDGVLGTLTYVSESGDRSTRYYYDARLRTVKEVRTIAGNTWTMNWTYDSADRVNSMRYPENSLYSFGYNLQGALNNISNVLSNLDYNSQDKVIRKQFPNGVNTTLNYDLNSFQLSSILTQKSTTYQSLNFTYDNVGNIKSINDEGVVQNFYYDDLDRLVSVLGSDYNHAYSYDSIGNMLVMSDTANLTTFGYGAGISSGAGPHAMNMSVTTIGLPFIVVFQSPTLANGSSYNRPWTEANISMSPGSLDSFRFNWNGNNYSVYNNSLILVSNYNNNSAVGDSPSTAVDVSRYATNGTINGAVWSTGKYGKALSFDGVDDYVDYGNPANLNPGKITLGTWFKSDGSTASYQNIAGKGNYYWILLDPSMQYYVEVHTPSGFFGQGTGKTIKATGEWIHVALTYGGPDDRYMRLYENGVEIWSKDAGGALMDQAGYSFRVGASSWVPYPFDGSVDELRLYDRALSPNEVWLHYQSEIQKFNSTEYRFYANVTNLSAGTYGYYGWANNSQGSSGRTDSGSIRYYNYSSTTTTTTTTMPFSIAFQPPTQANGTVSNRPWTEANVSISTGGVDSFRFNLNGSNYTVYNSSLVLASNYNNNSAAGDSSTIASDISRYGSNGSISGATWSSGKYGLGLRFNGLGNYVEYGNPSNLNVGQITLEAWFNTSGSTGNYQNIAGKSNYYWILIDPSLQYYTEVHTPSGYHGQGTGKSVKAIGEWIHVALTYGGPSDRYMRLYENGKEIWSTDAGGASMDQTGESFRVGLSSYGGGAYPFNGSIDEVRIYNRSLSPTEVWLHYQSEMQRYNSSEYRFYVKLTNLSEGNYSYFGWANNSLGNYSKTDAGYPRYYTHQCNIWAYDTNGSCYIELTEALNAAIDFDNGLLSLNCAERVVYACNHSIRNPSCGGKMSDERKPSQVDMNLAVSLLSPSKGVNASEPRPAFGFKVSGYTLLYPCSLYVNGSVLASSYALNNTNKFIVPEANLEAGLYDWYVECSDFYSLSNKSESGSIYIKYVMPIAPDISDRSRRVNGTSWVGTTIICVPTSSRAPTTSTSTTRNASTVPETTTTTTSGVSSTTTKASTTIPNASLASTSSTTQVNTTTSLVSTTTTSTINPSSTTTKTTSVSDTAPKKSEQTTTTMKSATTTSTTTTSSRISSTSEASSTTMLPGITSEPKYSTTTSSTTENTTTTTSPPAICWDADNKYLYTGSEQYQKFCLCTSGTYEFSEYDQLNETNQAYEYVNSSNNSDWSVVNLSCDAPVYRVRCNTSWYATNETYEVVE